MNGIDESLDGITHKKINKKILEDYFEFAYLDLVERIGNKEGVSQEAFYLYMQFPPFLAKRLFECFAKKKKYILSQEDFINNLILLYAGDTKAKCELYFNIMDLNSDGSVLFEDIKIILIQLHIFKFANDFSLIEQSLGRSNIPESFTKDQWMTMVEAKQMQHELVILLDFFFENTKPFSRAALSRFETIDIRLYDNELKEESLKLSKELLDYFRYILTGLNNSKPPVIFLKQKKLSMCLGELQNNNKDDEFYTPSQPERFLRNNLHCSSKSTKTVAFSFKENILSSALKEMNSHSALLLKQSQIGEISTNDEEQDRGYNDYPLEFSSNIFLCVLIEHNDQKFHYNIELIDCLFILYETNTTDVIKRIIDLRYCYLEEEGLQLKINVCFNIGQSLLLLFENKGDYFSLIKRLKSNNFLRKVQTYYDMKELLGKGNFAEVYRAMNKHTGDEYAIKQIDKQHFEPKMLEYIYQEIFTIRYLTKINHKNIIKAFDIFEDSKYIYCVFEYLSLGDLDQYLKTNNIIPMKDIKHLCYEVAQTIAFLHKIGMIHRDLKLQNIMCKVDSDTNELGIKLIDFGFCTVLGRNQKKNDGIGTLNYMPPEIINRDDYSFKVDVWSFGVIMYYLRYNRLPFDDLREKINIIKQNIRLGSYKFGLKSPEISIEDDKGFKKIIEQCLQVAPDKRISSERLINDPWFLPISNID